MALQVHYQVIDSTLRRALKDVIASTPFPQIKALLFEAE